MPVRSPGRIQRGVLNIHQERMDAFDLNSMLKNFLTNEWSIAFFGHF